MTPMSFEIFDWNGLRPGDEIEVLDDGLVGICQQPGSARTVPLKAQPHTAARRNCDESLTGAAPGR